MRIKDKRDIMTDIIVGAMIKKGHGDVRHMHRNTVHARKKNEDLLFRILKNNKNTEYGKKYHFEDIKTLEDYRSMVPFTTYPDYEPYVERMINNGETDLLTAKPVISYAQSSGSVGGRKFVPITQDQVNVYLRYTVTKMMAITDDYYRKYYGRKLRPGRGLYTNHAIYDYLPNGVLCSNIADIAARKLGFLYPYLLGNPYKRLFTQYEAEFRYVNTRFALQDRNTMYIFTVFLKMFTDLIIYLKENWEIIVDDIEKGTISDIANATPEVLEQLKAKIKPDPERAAELRREFEKGFDETILTRLWPNMSVIYGIGTSTFEPFYRISKKYTGDLPYDFSVYAASEGLFAVTDEVNSAKQLMLVDSCFYEFVPVDDESKLLCIDELEIGKEYEMIITNQAGLYRYKCGDVIKVVDYLNECPYMQFAYRKGQLLNLAGEKTTEEHMQEAVNRIAELSGCTISSWTTGMVLDVRPCHYLLMLENSEGRDLSGYSEAADEILRDVNVRYAHFTDRSMMGKVKVVNLENGTNDKWIEMLADKGVGVSQAKPVRLIDTPEKEEFFFPKIIG